MNYRIIFMGLIVIVPLVGMDKNGLGAHGGSEAAQREDFKNSFFPDVSTSNSQDVLRACRFYNAIPSDLEIMPDVTFEKAKKYANSHQDRISATFMRFSNVLMVRTYKSGLSKEQRDQEVKEAVLSIGDDEELLSFILTGEKTKRCTVSEIWDKAIVFSKVVNSYKPADETQRTEKVLNG